MCGIGDYTSQNFDQKHFEEQLKYIIEKLEKEIKLLFNTFNCF